MLSQRAALTFLILVETAAFAFMSETVIFPAIIALAALVGWRRRTRIAMSHDRQVILSLVAALVFIVQWRVQPHVLPDDTMQYLSPFLHSLGQLLLVLQVAALYLEHPRDVLPTSLPWPGVFVMVSAGDMHVQDAQRFAFQIFSLAFMTATAMYFSASARAIAGIERRSYGFAKTGLIGVMLVGTAVVAWASASALHQYEHALDRLVGELLNPSITPSAGGFPSRSRLGSIARRKNERGSDIALRVYSSDAPGHLRGKAYHWLASVPGVGRGGGVQTEWEEAPPSRDPATSSPIDPEILTPFARERDGYRYVLNEHATPLDDPTARMTIWLEPPQWGTYFLPPRTSEIVTSENSLRRDCRWLISNTDAGAVTYTARIGSPPDATSFFDVTSDKGPYSRAALTRFPALFADDPQIKAIVEREFRDCRTVEEHVKAVERFFRSNYGYTIGIEVPPDRDPIRWFLVARPNAHCEYFAQGAALLLRMRGIPTRYMTGFVAAERNDYGGYWLARNEHAHAWCEAWDDERGWVVVEATPPAGVPLQTNDAPRHRQLWEFLSGAVEEFRYRFASGGWKWLMKSLATVLLTPAGGLALLVAAVYVLVRWRWTSKRGEEDVGPTIAALQRIRGRMDRRLARQGLIRRPGETLTQFAARIEQETRDAETARWYDDYAAARYDARDAAAAVASLRERLSQIERPRRRRAIVGVSEERA
jgi:transglutaminase-like putative cysteine protease